MPTSKRMIPDQSADLFFGCLSVIRDLLTSAKRADILQISLTTCSLLILPPSNVAIIVSFCHRAAQPSHCESRNRVRAGVTATVYSIPQAAAWVSFRESVEAFGGLVASYSQDPLTCRHVNQLGAVPVSFTILVLSPDADPSWPERISRAVPGAVAKIYADPKDALADIETADAAYGTVPPELFARAKKLRWICASHAGLGCQSSLIGQARCASRAGRARGSFRPACGRSGSGRA
jgi:hypothetical protein